MKDDKLYLIHIKECIDRIQQYTRNDKKSFLVDTKIQDAVLRNLHTLTESIQKLSESLKAQHQEIDWRAIAGFRNVVVHDYLGIDVEQIWDVVDRDLPPLKAKIEQLIDQS